MMVSPLGFKSLGPWRASSGSELAHGQGDTRPTSLAGHLRESFTCWKLLRDFACRALQGKDLFGIPHAYGEKRRCALKPLFACRLLLRKHENKIHLP